MAAAFKASYPSHSDVSRAYNPAHWGYAAQNPAKAYAASCPALGEMDSLYGTGTAANWIDLQVSALFGASSKSDKALADGIGIFADTFAAEVRAYKLSELMLFFARYKAGVYDNSYATFDTRRIGHARTNTSRPANCPKDTPCQKATTHTRGISNGCGAGKCNHLETSSKTITNNDRLSTIPQVQDGHQPQHRI